MDGFAAMSMPGLGLFRHPIRKPLILRALDRYPDTYDFVIGFMITRAFIAGIGAFALSVMLVTGVLFGLM